MANELVASVAALCALDLSGPQLQIYLWRLCEEQLPAIRELARSRAQMLAIMERSNELRVSGDAPHLRVRVALREADQDQLLAVCAAGLLALDRHHRARPHEIRHVRWALPAGLGGGYGWLLPPSTQPFAEAIGERRDPERGPGDFGPDLRTELDLWWMLVWGGRGVDLDVAPLDSLVSEVLEWRVPYLRFGLAAPFVGLRYRYASRPQEKGSRGTPYRFIELYPEDRLAAAEALHRIVAQCRAEKIDVLCLPELTLDAGLHAELVRLLKSGGERYPALVIAGSQHEGEPPDCINRARVLDWSGAELWVHDKSACFRITPGEASKMSFDSRTEMGIDADGGEEDIRLGTTLALRDGPLGRMGVVICLDFLDRRVQDLLLGAAATCLFVPAMTAATAPFEAVALELSKRARTASFVANSGWYLAALPKEQVTKAAVALVFLPAAGAKEQRSGEDELHLFTIRELLERR